MSQVVDYLKSNGQLSANQLGFCKVKSVEDQLLVTYGELFELIDMGYLVMIFLDFLKTFGVVNHSIMLTKLQMLDIGGKLLSWICEFLSSWTMSVKVAGKMSSLKQVTSCVSQGLVLGSVLFFRLYVDVAYIK